MGAILEVKVLSRAGHSEQSEAQLRKGDRAWGGSVERKPWADGQEPDIEAVPIRASGQMIAKLLWSKIRRRKSGGRAVKDRALTWGDLASRVKARR